MINKLTIVNDLSEFWNLDPSSLKGVPIVMCLWQRLENLHKTLALLHAQNNTNFDLFLWNNNTQEKDKIEEYLKKINVNYNIYLYTHEENIGGFGRFYLSRALNKLKHYKSVIFIDDDEMFEKTMVDEFMGEAEPMKMTSIWAHSFVKGHPYPVRRKVLPNEPCHYCGTGGMVVDISIFADNMVFECPKKYWYIEDLWLSYIGSIKGWKLCGSYARIYIDHHDGKDMRKWQKNIPQLKIEMLEYLRQKGWNA